jgi:hypothetical protein
MLLEGRNEALDWLMNVANVKGRAVFISQV